MAKPGEDDKRWGLRLGPRGLGALIPDVVRPAFRRRSPAVARLAVDWPALVGPALAAVTAPKKLFQGTLSISAGGPVAMELQHLAVPLMNRINLHLGDVQVTRLRFVQDFAAPGAVAPPPTPTRGPARIAAAEAVAPLPPGALRDALERLGRVVLAG